MMGEVVPMRSDAVTETTTACNSDINNNNKSKPQCSNGNSTSQQLKTDLRATVKVVSKSFTLL